MKIKSLQLKNFKRFTDLTLQDIPVNAKLVLLIGLNGSGKSSVLDAFQVLNRHRSLQVIDNTDSYYSKKGIPFQIIADFGDTFKTDTSITTTLNDRLVKGNLTTYYGRTSFRQIPRLTKLQLGSQYIDISSDHDKPYYFIDRDERFENDLEHLFGKLLKEFFRTSSDKSEIKDKVIDPINKSLEKIFGHQNGSKLSLLELIPPLEGKVAEINFKKGESIFHYNYLSAGEKEVFNILINLVARREYFTDTIFFYDEIDLHLNTKLQYNFLNEILETWIPSNCQFWSASHSLGFIQYAREKENAAIFDFDDYDFDYPKTLSPEPKDNPDLYEIAVSKELLPWLFKDRKIIFVENEDTRYYASLNSSNMLFVPEKNRDAVFYKVKSGQFSGLVDRDFLSDSDIKILNDQYPNLKVLGFYCVENYLFHPDNLEEFFISNNKTFDKAAYIQKIFEEKELVKKQLLIKIATVRQAYPYFKEPGMEKSPYKKRFTPDRENYIQSEIVADYLDSKDENEYLKSFSLKDNCKSLPERQNVSPFELSKTKWFLQQIESIINKT